MHGILADEVAEIVAVFHEWGEVDRSHRKLAHRGSYLHRVWVSPSTVRRVLAGQGLVLRPPPRPGRSVRRPFPELGRVPPEPDLDTTHFPRAGLAGTVIEDLVSRKWLAHIVSAEETSTQVEVVSTDALAAEGLLAGVEARADGVVPVDVDDEARPILLAVSDSGPQMTSGSTREFGSASALTQQTGEHSVGSTSTGSAGIDAPFVAEHEPVGGGTEPYSGGATVSPETSGAARTQSDRDVRISARTSPGTVAGTGLARRRAAGRRSS